MGVRSALRAFFNMVKLILSSAGITIGFYFRRRRAISRFREELIASGLSRREADEIAEDFPLALGEVWRLLREA